MKTLIKLMAMGAFAAIAVKIYRLQQRRDRGVPDELGGSQDFDQVADTNSVVTGDAFEEQNQPQPQDWRGAQNVVGP